MNDLKGPFGEEIKITNKLPKKILNLKNATFFVDHFFKDKISFSKKSKIIFLKASENLKTFKTITSLTDILINNGHQKNDPIVCIGGGSLGDSIGFLASIYLRGVPYYQVPTTWLSVVDSSLGGKTALNFGKLKNQVGSFYAPKEIIISKDLLKTSSLKEARGEILKTLALNINKKWARLQLENLEKMNIPKFLEYKTQIVKRDFFDNKGIRAVLNLGHTLAHAIELEFQVSHSIAVEAGLKFALNWSVKKKFIKKEKLNSLYHNISDYSFKFSSQKDLEKYILSDKKTNGLKVNFVFLGEKGAFLKKVPVISVVKEYFRQVKNNEL